MDKLQHINQKPVKFGEMSLSPILDGYRFEYGGLKGWQVFDSHEDMAKHLASWSVKELSRLAKEIEAIAKLQRYLEKQ